MNTKMREESQDLEQSFKQQKLDQNSTLAIQATNSSSIVCKRSVERLYTQPLKMNLDVEESKGCKEYIKYFVPKSIRCTPCINRGYWLRMHAIKSTIDSIVGETEDEKVVILNLGCGFDPLPFQLLDSTNRQNEKNLGRLSFLDIDYPDLISHKKHLIDSTPELKSIVGSWSESDRIKGALEAEKYTLVPCDLNDIDDFNALIQACNHLQDASLVKIFVAEVSLAYMESENADAIIEICSRQPRSHFVVLEPLVPAGPLEPFSRQMLQHFIKNSTPLRSINSYQTLSAQHKRFQRLGFQSTKMQNMLDVWNSVSSETKMIIDQIEPFDEYEEFLMYCHHYILGHSTNHQDFRAKCSSVTTEKTVEKMTLRPEMNINAVRIKDMNLLQRKFGSSTLLPSGQILYSHGSYASRLDNTLLIDPVLNTAQFVVSNSCQPTARMCHTLIALNNELCVLVGGRASPSRAHDDIWLLKKTELSQWVYEKALVLPESRYRHSTCAIDQERVLIYGGHTTGAAFLIYDSQKNELTVPTIDGEIPSLASAALSYDLPSSTGVIIGGVGKDQNIDGGLRRFHYDTNSNKITLTKRVLHPLLQRCGAKSQYTNSDTILIAGGTNSNMLLDRDTTIIEVNIDNEQITRRCVPEHLWKAGFPLLVGFEMQKTPDSMIHIFGGGAVCYGFGSVWNGWLKLKIM
ncbi:LAFA_0C02322g1_1 [Lachancea sp. 'fantastica']|nr:LAFA_0C02322g1_1 [Lachancea sp. 'fantastica']